MLLIQHWLAILTVYEVGHSILIEWFAIQSFQFFSMQVTQPKVRNTYVFRYLRKREYEIFFKKLFHINFIFRSQFQPKISDEILILPFCQGYLTQRLGRGHTSNEQTHQTTVTTQRDCYLLEKTLQGSSDHIVIYPAILNSFPLPWLLFPILNHSFLPFNGNGHPKLFKISQLLLNSLVNNI